MTEQQSFDYIVIGSGASGAVVANRLSADPSRRVLLLEAGPGYDKPDLSDVGGFVRLWGSDVDWSLATEPQVGMAGRQITINQGKVAGGSTSVNAMMYVRGNPRNFDMWNAMGADGWSYADVLPYFKQIEDYEGGADEYHGVGGDIPVRVCPDDVMRSEPFLVGATELGYDGPHWDYNGGRQENGAALLQFHIDKDGRRASSHTVFVQPILDRPNFTFLTDAFVTKLVTEGTRVVGVEYRKDGELQTARCDGEVIVSAGALQSPKILLVSGIGPADHLRSVGVPVVADVPGVGQNLQDHVQLPVIYRSKGDDRMTTLLTGNTLFVNTRDGSSAAPPDLQLNFTPAIPAPLAPLLPNFGGPVAIFLPILVQPFSIGWVKLRSSDPSDAPLINPNYLSTDADVRVLVKAIELIRAIAGTRAFSSWGEVELAPGPGDPTDFIRTQSSTLWHPAGTCRIGWDAMAVVDPQLRVHGVQGLRVVDASVMPTVTSGNTVAGCFMIGAKAADMIIQGAKQAASSAEVA